MGKTNQHFVNVLRSALASCYFSFVRTLNSANLIWGFIGLLSIFRLFIYDLLGVTVFQDYVTIVRGGKELD